MTFEEFESFVKDEPGIGETMNRAAAEAMKVKKMDPCQRHAGTRGSRGTYGPVAMAAGMGALVILFPIVKRIVYRLGLPWLKTAERYSELWRQEVERWLDEEHERRGFDPAVSKAASEALLSELEQTTEKESREGWERLMAIMRKDEQE